MGGATFSLGYILVRPGTAARYSLWLRPLLTEGRDTKNKMIRKNPNEMLRVTMAAFLSTKTEMFRVVFVTIPVDIFFYHGQ